MSPFSVSEYDLYPAAAAWRQHAWQLVSFLLHAALVASLWLVGTLPPCASSNPVTYRVLAHVYVPPRAAEGTKPSPQGSAIDITAPRAGGTHIDLTGLTLRTKDDPGFEILGVLAHFGGYLGVTENKEPRYIIHLFRAPDWGPVHEGSYVSLESFFAFRIVEPQDWPLVVALERKYRIRSDALVYALFPPRFEQAVDAAIREEAARQIRQGRVTAASIAFSSKSSLGFVVENVTLEQLP